MLEIRTGLRDIIMSRSLVFFMIIIPERSPILIVPKLEYAHMQKTGIGEVLSYTEFPAPKGEGWQEFVSNTIKSEKNLGVEPSLSLSVTSPTVYHG